MRAHLRLPAIALALLLAAIPATASLGYGEPVEPGEYCPTYEVDTGDMGEGAPRAQVSTADPWGAMVLSADRYYVVEDTLYANALGEPYLFSLWVYEESNGIPGLQRGDPVCVDVPPGVEPDTIVNS